MDTTAIEETPRLSDFDLEVPEHLIAQFPPEERDHCRLMVLDRAAEVIGGHRFYELSGFLNEGDVLVLNDTRVFPARLYATREGTSARIEVLLLQELENDRWEVLVRPGRKVRVGDRLLFNGEAHCRVMDSTASGGRVVHFQLSNHSLHDFLEQHGRSPLPPYIRREPEPQDRSAYQTVYARHRGAVAAPTAGLHFTEALLDQLRAKGVQLVYITLHIGLGTFRPVQVEDVTRHHMDAEYYSVSEESAEAVNRALAGGQRVVAVGTSTARTLETLAARGHQITSGEGWTDLFIYPPYEFKIVDAMLTNFHLPRSTLIMMVSAFMGRQFLFRAYRQAVREEYRFYSYGDAMLIL
ncbi:MAG: tRNA preQ1(34) S-adenosylmethionine ribosyltransferase-isomerase QueA [Fidelibacterota bacterium]|nr:MAG: tRNA preQ1(34) S-adenosylmethionine ribosyltransferase-isomerase QueA [Candidatus Neomarinimicrobiota bacterium]